MITSVHIAIDRHLQGVTYDRYVSESYENGELTPVYATGTNINLAIFPIGRKDLQFFPEGEYTFQDKKFYEKSSSGTIPNKSIIHVGTDKYLVDGGTDRNHAGGYITYLGKRISDSE
jgi:hypothetical protein